MATYEGYPLDSRGGFQHQVTRIVWDDGTEVLARKAYAADPGLPARTQLCADHYQTRYAARLITNPGETDGGLMAPGAQSRVGGGI